jgi:hypothetical protein
VQASPETISRAELRKFGLVVGAAFGVLGLISWWRGHVVAPRVLWTIGILLIAPGLLAPALLRPVQRVWMRAAAGLGYVNTRVILSALFYLVFTPVGLVLRLFRDPLHRSFDDQSGSQWVKRTPAPVERASYERQF